MGVFELIRGKKEENCGLIGVIEEALKKKEWWFRRDANSNVINTGANCTNADFRAFFVANEDRSVVLLYVEYSPKVPEGRRKEAADFLTRANFGLWIGNFEMDMENGEVRYKVSLDLENGTLSHEMIDNMIGAGISTADRYFPAFMSVCYGNAIPSVAVREVET